MLTYHSWSAQCLHLTPAGQVDRLTPGLDCTLKNKLRETESLEGQVTRLEHQLAELVVAVQGEEYYIFLLNLSKLLRLLNL
jgi:hypothetical protein